MSTSYRRVVAGLVGSALALASTAARAETLILTSINAPAHWSEIEGHVPFMECVKKGTNNEIDFKYFHSGQIATVATALDALNNGVAHISFVVPSGISDKLPIANIPLLPDMGDSVTDMVRAFRKVADSDGPFAKEFAANGIKPLILNVFPAYQMMARKEGIKTADAFKNKKIRIAGGAQSFGMTALGAVPVQIGFGEIFIAMQQGTVDAYIFSSMTVKNFSLQEVTKAMSRNGNFGTAVGVIAIDNKMFNSLSPAKQKVLVDCGREREAHLAKYADENDGKLFDEFAKMGIDVYKFTDQDKAAINDKLKLAQTDYVGRLVKRGLPAQEAFDEYRKALAK
jgi:TRAP-type transport system periplasmic protein